MISEGYIHNFQTLCRALNNGDGAIVECTDAVTKKPVMVIAAIQRNHDGSIEMKPLAKMFDGNPYQELIPPEAPGLQAQKA